MGGKQDSIVVSTQDNIPCKIFLRNSQELLEPLDKYYQIKGESINSQRESIYEKAIDVLKQ